MSQPLLNPRIFSHHRQIVVLFDLEGLRAHSVLHLHFHELWVLLPQVIYARANPCLHHSAWPRLYDDPLDLAHQTRLIIMRQNDRVVLGIAVVIVHRAAGSVLQGVRRHVEERAPGLVEFLLELPELPRQLHLAAFLLAHCSFYLVVGLQLEQDDILVTDG